MLPLLLNAGYLAVAPFFLGRMLYKRRKSGKYKESLPGMLGYGWDRFRRDVFADGSVWIHAVSVGESVAAKALLPQVQQHLGHLPLVVTTTTETGQARARELFPRADAVLYFPADLTWIVRRFHEHFQPRVLFLMETELWPNHLLALRERGVPGILVNGKISEDGFRGYGRFRFIFQPALEGIRMFSMQTEEDAHRIRVLSGRPHDVLVGGSIKFDSLPQPLSPAERAALRTRLALPEAAPVLLAGSTHPGEEEIILDAYFALRDRHPDLRLVLCPRHPERFDEVWETMERRFGVARRRPSRADVPLAKSPGRIESAEQPQRRVARLSMLEPLGLRDVEALLLDGMGLLGQAFGIANVAILGGSFVPVGGHNLLEPAAHGVPVVCGPDMHSQPEIVRIMKEAGLLNQTEAAGLSAMLERLLFDLAARTDIAQRSLAMVEAGRGAAARCVEEAIRRGLLPLAEAPAASPR